MSDPHKHCVPQHEVTMSLEDLGREIESLKIAYEALGNSYNRLFDELDSARRLLRNFVQCSDPEGPLSQVAVELARAFLAATSSGPSSTPSP